MDPSFFEPQFTIPSEPQRDPIISFGRTHTGAFDIHNPVGIAVHPINGLIFIAENTFSLNAAPDVLVFTPQGDYVTSFTNYYIVSPCKFSLTIEPCALYILDELRQGLTQYTDFTIRTICPVDSSLPRGIACDEDGFLYVIDAYQRRVCVYNLDFQLERYIYLKIVAFPLGLQLLTDILVIFCNPPSILYCSIQGEKLRYITRINQYVRQSMYFCVDPETNWTLISNSTNRRILIFDMEGQLVRTVSPKLSSTEGFFPSLLCVTPHRTLVVFNSNRQDNPFHIFAL